MSTLFIILAAFFAVSGGIVVSTAFVKGGKVNKQRIGIAVLLFVIAFIFMVMSAPIK